MRNHIHWSGGIAFAALALASTAAGAQEQSVNATGETSTADRGDGAQEIIVTAQRREQRLQDVPLTIQALGAAALAERRVENISALTVAIPSVTISGVSNLKPVLYIRGIGTRQFGPGADQSVGVFLDDFYVGDASTISGGLTDIERVEILKGPQGTLYGRNTIAGAISIVTQDPTDTTHAKFEGSVGNFDYRSFKGSVSGPLVEDKLAGRLSFFTTKRDGYLKILNTGGAGLGLDQTGVRGKLLWHAAPALDVTLIADYNRDTSPGQLGKRLGPGTMLKAPRIPNPAIPADPYETFASFNPTTDATNYGANLKVRWSGDDFTILSLSQYRHNRFRNLTDLDGSALETFHVDGRQHSRTVSQEFRFTSDPSGGASFGGKLDWIGGLFFYRQKASAIDFVRSGVDGFAFQVSGRPANTSMSTDLTATSLAAYADLTFHLTPTLSLTGGLRYSHDKKTGVEAATTDNRGVPPVAAPFSVPVSFRKSSVDPKIALSWKATDAILAYASFSTGYKSGGFQYLASSPTIAASTYGPERVDYYEAGVKTQWFDRKLTINAAGFYGKYRGLQLVRIVGTSSFTDNAAKVKLRGFELESRLALGRLSLDASYTYLDNEFDEYNQCTSAAQTNCADLGGTRLPRSPTSQIVAGAAYKLPLSSDDDLTFRADWNHRSSYILEPGGFGATVPGVGRVPTLNTYTVQPTVDLLDLRASYRHKAWTLSIWGQNMTNQAYADAVVVFGSIVTPLGQIGDSTVRYPSPPRTYGATLAVAF